MLHQHSFGLASGLLGLELNLHGTLFWFLPTSKEE